MTELTSPQSLPQRVPEDFELRRRIRDAARTLVRERNLIPPQTLESLRVHAHICLENLRKTGGLPGEKSSNLTSNLTAETGTVLPAETGLENFTLILLNNALWERYFPAIPIDQRLLLLPFCLRDQERCRAPRDDLGLICDSCCDCRIPELSDLADRRGMPVLVAESSSRVAEWVERGEIDAVVGVSCLKSLEKAFPSMLRYAVPGIAVSLTRDGCVDTTFDRDFLNEAIALQEDPTKRGIPYSQIRRRTETLFSPEGVRKYLMITGAADDVGKGRTDGGSTNSVADGDLLAQFPAEVERVLCAHGKHYRPMIALGTCGVLTQDSEIPEFMDPIALAVECFHKASLIHDDIEDRDEVRYDEPTLHRRIGIAAALNIGDFLIGEGYRLLGDARVPEAIRGELVTQSAIAHGELSLGQAREFELIGRTISLEACLETHRLKTAPAFRVALNLGAIAAGVFERYRELFHRIADQLGVAYQLLDDLADTQENPASSVDGLMRQRGIERTVARGEITILYERYREQTYTLLEEISESRLKIFLWRLTGKVLKDV